ncbi:MAG TPA: glycosyl hydrolase, partial [Nitrolancea sp.]|nr:glycosyl hydrolase [Nitrolancea sp.]
DNHDLWIDPHNTQRMIEGNDGGANVTYNGGRSWSSIYNQPTAQLYHITTDNQVPYRLYGSQQDNSAITVPSMSVTGAINMTEWFEPGGGESGYIAVKPTDHNLVVGGGIGSGEGDGRLIRYNHATGQHQNITVWPVESGMGTGANEMKYRFQWTFPILYSPHDPDTLYVTSNVVHRSTDEGMNWSVISPDLTRNDPATQEASGGPITKDNTGAEVYGTIFAFVESPHQQGLFWAGSDDGLIHISKDNGQSWQNITPPDLPANAMISILEASPHDVATAYVAATCYKSDDPSPYLYKTTDYGQSWTKIVNGLPQEAITRVIREDPSRKGLLYAGTETGLFVSLDDGANWERWQLNLPVAPLYDLAIKDTDLIAATHGRSFWILDDLTPLHQLTDQVRNAASHLFKPRDTTRIKIYEGYGSDMDDGTCYINAGPLTVAYRKIDLPNGLKGRKFLDAGQNPPNGVIVSYLLKDEPNDDITLTFLNDDGSEIRTFSSAEPPKVEGEDGPSEPRLVKTPGWHRFTWDMRLPDAEKIPGDKSAEGYLHGPVVVPGTYKVRLTVGNESQEQPFSILRDPRISASQADLQAQFDLLVKIRDRVSDAHRAVNKIRALRTQLDGWEKRLDAQQETIATADTLLESVKSLKEKLTSVEDALVQVKSESPLQFPSRLNSKMATLSAFVDNADFAPTTQTKEAFEELSTRIGNELQRLNDIETNDLAPFNEALRQANVPVVGPA